MSESLFIEPIKKLVLKMQKRLSELMNNSPDSGSSASLQESNNLDTNTFNKTDIENQPLGQIPAFIPEIDDDLLEIDTVDNNFLSTEEEQVEDTNDLSEFNLEGELKQNPAHDFFMDIEADLPSTNQFENWPLSQEQHGIRYNHYVKKPKPFAPK